MDNESPFFVMLQKALAVAGSQSALAEMMGVSQQAVSDLVKRKSNIPERRVLAVEEGTGISRHDLRPDMYPRDNPPPADHSAQLPSADTPSSSAGGSSSSLDGVRA